MASTPQQQARFWKFYHKACSASVYKTATPMCGNRPLGSGAYWGRHLKVPDASKGKQACVTLNFNTAATLIMENI